MCGIVGYIGKAKASEVVIKGLERLEYRGYDSCGISYYNELEKEFITNKGIGRVASLYQEFKYPENNQLGIGHTRWATHGVANYENTHPHYSESKRFIIVHNGVIDNHKELVYKYLNEYTFRSDTDTEVIINLIEEFAKKKSVEDSIRKTISLLEGSYAFLVLDTEDTNHIYAVKNKSPLLIGESKDGIVLGSDVLAFVNYADNYYLLEDNSVIVVEKNDDNYSFKVTDAVGFDNNHLKKLPMDFIMDDLDKAGYEHYMLKEISEQPAVVRKIMKEYMVERKLRVQPDIKKMFDDVKRIYILAAGTSYHAGLIGRVYFEEIAKIPAEVFIASEFAYNEPLIEPNSIFILISQSGETADLRACLMKTKKMHYKTLTITNVKTSTLARESNYFLELFAGPEIAVASTKAYVAQIGVLSVLAYALSEQTFDLKKALTDVALSIEDFLSSQDVSSLVHKIIIKRNCFYIGRTIDYYTALEAALKLKEISYIQTEGFAAGELKHGTIALIEEGTPVVALISNKDISSNTRSNLNEVIARGASTIKISLKSTSHQDDDIILKDVHPLLTPMVMVVPTQLFAYYAALERGLDIDKPRNLAKSVTVE